MNKPISIYQPTHSSKARWICKCGASNIVKRKKCRVCGEYTDIWGDGV